jgi:outer membrane beta-barrel protein
MLRRQRLWLVAFAASAILSAPASAWAQDDDDDDMTFAPDDVSKPKDEPKPDEPGTEPGTEPEPEPGTEPEPEPTIDDSAAAKAAPEEKLGEKRVSWQDIVVVVRKPFLKNGRIELLPTWGVTMNDNIIQHVQFNGQLNYYLTDVLAVGVEGGIFVKNLREPFDLVAREARRLPTVNKYNYAAALNFHYVPVYGKFAILDRKIIHWETFFTAGVGFTQSEVLPRDPALQPFKNFLITPNVGASMRFFITRFLTVTLGVRDYVFVDKFEAVGRTEISGSQAKENASSALINNVMFQAGISFWFPTGFEYTTFR